MTFAFSGWLMSVAAVVVESPTQAGLKVSAEFWSREEKLLHVCPGIQYTLAPAVPPMWTFWSTQITCSPFNFANYNNTLCRCSVIDCLIRLFFHFHSQDLLKKHDYVQYSMHFNGSPRVLTSGGVVRCTVKVNRVVMAPWSRGEPLLIHLVTVGLKRSPWDEGWKELEGLTDTELLTCGIGSWILSIYQFPVSNYTYDDSSYLWLILNLNPEFFQNPKSKSIHPWVIPKKHGEFHPDPCTVFWLMLTSCDFVGRQNNLLKLWKPNRTWQHSSAGSYFFAVSSWKWVGRVEVIGESLILVINLPRPTLSIDHLE